MKNINKIIGDKLLTEKDQSEIDNLRVIKENFGHLGASSRGEINQKITKYNKKR